MKRKEFEVTVDEQTLKLAVKPPSPQDVDEAQRVYSSTVAKLVKNSKNQKLLLRSELDDFLRNEGYWTEEDENAAEAIRSDITDMLDKLRKGGLTLSEGRKIALAISERRLDFMHLLHKRRVFDESTIESQAENERTDYLVFTSTVYAESGERYWNSFDDMKSDKFGLVYQHALGYVNEMIFGVDGEFEKKLPENQWLSKYGFVDDDLRLVDRKSGDFVDREGKPIKELEERLKKELTNLAGPIEEEQPFIDDETGEPVTT